MKRILKILLFFLIFVIVVMFYSLFIVTNKLETHEYRVDTPTLDESYNGLKIVHFSDLHYLRNLNENKLDKIIDEINLIPDVIIDFSIPEATFSILNFAKKNKIPTVIATTRIF